MHLEDTLTECDSSSSVDESTYGRTTSIVYFSFKLPLYTLWHPLWPSIREFIVLQINKMLASAINTVAVHSAERKKTAKQNMRMGCNHAISAVIKCTDRRWAVVFLSFCIVFFDGGESHAQWRNQTRKFARYANFSKWKQMRNQRSADIQLDIYSLYGWNWLRIQIDQNYAIIWWGNYVDKARLLLLPLFLSVISVISLSHVVSTDQ